MSDGEAGLELMYPDYHHSILSLISSILTHYGVDANHTTLPELDKLLQKKYRNIVLMLFDGMGVSALEAHLPPDAFLRKAMRGTLSSVFPPTTTAATVTLETGLSPIEHGWLAWTMYFADIDKKVALFHNTVAGEEGQAAPYHVAKTKMPYTDVYEKIRQVTNAQVQAEFIAPFSAYHSKSVRDICISVRKLCKAKGRHYIATYWHHPDYDMHEKGVGHKDIAKLICKYDCMLERLSRSLPDTLLIVTADHGLVDTQWRFIPDYPQIQECLLRSPAMESRVLSFQIKEGMHAQFKQAFQEVFGAEYLLLTKQEALDKELFGAGTPHSVALQSIGDYLAIATGDVTIECTPSAQHPDFKAVHAGLSKQEMLVPFIAVDCANG